MAAVADRGQHPPLVAADLDVLARRVGARVTTASRGTRLADLPPLVDLGPTSVEDGRTGTVGLPARETQAPAVK